MRDERGRTNDEGQTRRQYNPPLWPEALPYSDRLCSSLISIPHLPSLLRHTLAASTSSGTTSRTSNSPVAVGGFPQIAQGSVRDEASGQAQKRLGQHQPDDAFLAPLQQLHDGHCGTRSSACRKHLAFGRADVFRLLLPLAIDLRLLVAHVLDEHPLPQPLVEVFEPLDLLQLDPQCLGDDLGRLQRRLRDGRRRSPPSPCRGVAPTVAATSARPRSFSGISRLPRIRSCTS